MLLQNLLLCGLAPKTSSPVVSNSRKGNAFSEILGMFSKKQAHTDMPADDVDISPTIAAGITNELIQELIDFKFSLENSTEETAFDVEPINGPQELTVDVASDVTALPVVESKTVELAPVETKDAFKTKKKSKFLKNLARSSKKVKTSVVNAVASTVKRVVSINNKKKRKGSKANKNTKAYPKENPFGSMFQPLGYHVEPSALVGITIFENLFGTPFSCMDFEMDASLAASSLPPLQFSSLNEQGVVYCQHPLGDMFGVFAFDATDIAMLS